LTGKVIAGGSIFSASTCEAMSFQPSVRILQVVLSKYLA